LPSHVELQCCWFEYPREFDHGSQHLRHSIQRSFFRNGESSTNEEVYGPHPAPEALADPQTGVLRLSTVLLAVVRIQFSYLFHPQCTHWIARSCAASGDKRSHSRCGQQQYHAAADSKRVDDRSLIEQAANPA
jgi:hypothetical protein